MNYLNPMSYFGQKEEEKSYTKQIMDTLGSMISVAYAKSIPGIEKEISDEINAMAAKVNDEENIQAIVDYTISSLKAVVAKKTKDLVIFDKIRTDGIAAAKSLNDDIMAASRMGYHDKVKLMKKYSKQLKNKKRIKIVLIGKTQNGKSKFIKYLLNLKDVDMPINESNLGSDTDNIREYYAIKNGIEIHMVDTPGKDDTRGKDVDARNYQNILTYLRENNDIDLIFFVDKLENVICQNTVNMIEELTKLYGVNVWQKCMVILTHANCARIPDQYFIKHIQQYDPSSSPYSTTTISSSGSSSSPSSSSSSSSSSSFSSSSSSSRRNYRSSAAINVSTPSGKSTLAADSARSASDQTSEIDSDPEDYFQDNFSEEQMEIIKLAAWKDFTAAKIQVWKEKFSPLNPDIPICLVESSRRYAKRVDNKIGVLLDGTPILETVMSEMLKMCVDNVQIGSLIFMALAKDQTEKEVEEEIQRIDNGEQPVMTEHMTAVDNATNKNGWFVKFLKGLGLTLLLGIAIAGAVVLLL